MTLSLYLGPYQPFLEEELCAAVRDFRASDDLAPLILLVPNRSLVRHLRETVVRSNGSAFNLRVRTLHQYLLESAEETWMAGEFRLLPESLAPWVLRENARAQRPKGGGPFVAVEGTPGFHKALRTTLAELRQGGFTSGGLSACSKAVGKDKDRRRLSEKLAAFADLLARYENWKRDKKWKDREDLYHDFLALPPPPAPVWTYGFYDASVLQKRVLQHLCSSREARWFIPYEDHPAFHYAGPFVEWAKGLGKVEKAGSFKSGKGTALGRLQDNLFLTDAPSPLMGEGGGEEDFVSSDVKVLLCPGESREMREAARVLTEEAGRRETRFSRCGLLIRQLETYRRMIAPAFGGQKVPLAKNPPVFLMETPEAKALLLLLKCFQAEFARETLVDFLSCPNLDPEGFGVKEEDWNPHLWDQASKEAGVVEGEGAWMDRLRDYAKPRSGKAAWEEDDLSTGDSRSLSAFRAQVLQKLFDAGRLFEKQKDWAGKTGVLFELAEKVFLPSRAKDELKTLRRGVETLSKDSFTVEKGELEALLSGLMDEVRIPWEAPEFGGVEMSDLMQARGVPFDVLVLPGLVEEGFPRAPRQDPLLLDEERNQLNHQDTKAPRKASKGEDLKPFIPLKSEGRKEEKLLFLLAVRSARQCVILTASHLHPGTGAPRVPSSYLYETLRAVTGGRQTRWEQTPAYVRKVAVSDWVRGKGDARVDDLEEVLSRFEEARKGNPLPAQAYVEGKPFFAEARRLLKERQGSRKFTPYDGVFKDAGTIEKLRQDYSLRDKTLSASRLETYAACPLQYFYRYVLGLKVHPEPERVFQLESKDKGTLMHSVLEETLSRGVKEGWLKARDGEKAGKALEEETQKAFQKFEKEGLPGSPALWQWNQFSLRKDLEKALKKALEDQDWIPTDFEVAFGQTQVQRQDAKTPREVLFTLEDGRTFKLEGFMDRVDLSPDGEKLRVVDYKTGSSDGFKKDSVKEGTKIQMPLYLWACRTLYPGVVPKQAVYEFITSKGGYRSVPYDASDWQKVEEPLKTLLATAAEAVDQGLFPAAAKACEKCDYRPLCGPGVEKRGGRKRDDQRAEGYFKLEDLT